MVVVWIHDDPPMIQVNIPTNQRDRGGEGQGRGIGTEGRKEAEARIG